MASHELVAGDLAHDNAPSGIAVGDVFVAVPHEVSPFKGKVRVVAIQFPDVAVMRVDIDPLRAPVVIAYGKLKAALMEKRVVPALFDVILVPSVEQLQGEERNHFDRVLKLMGPLLFDEGHPDLNRLIFNKAFRRTSFKAHATWAMKECVFKKPARKLSVERKIYRYFFRFLSLGMVLFALAGAQERGDAPPRLQAADEDRRGPNKTRVSLVKLPEVRGVLEKYAEPFLEKKDTMWGAWVKMLRWKYLRPDAYKKLDEHITYTIEQIKELLQPLSQIPTFRQFRYVCDCLKAKREPVGGNACDARPPIEKSPRRGRARDGVPGPGFRYEIDATKHQVQLVLRFNRKRLIGPATLYLVVDVFSTAIVGYAYSINHAGWPLGAAAMRNAVSDKTEVFERLGRPFDKDVFPDCGGLAPQRLLADYQAFHTEKAEPLRDFEITPEIAAVGRGEDKGTVEGSIGIVKHRGPKLGLVFPGEYPKNPRRGEKDGKSDAALTIPEADERVLSAIKAFNNGPVPRRNIPPEALGEGLVRVTRNALFNWGKEHRPGHFLRRVSKSDRIKHFMSKGETLITQEGLSFDGQTFSSQLLQDKRYLADLKRRGKYVEIRHDELSAVLIWFWDYRSGTWVEAFNTDENVVRLQAAFLELQKSNRDIDRLRFEDKLANTFNQQNQNRRLNTEARRNNKIAKSQRGDQSRTKARAGIRANQPVERAMEGLERAAEAHKIYGVPGAEADSGTAPTSLAEAGAPVASAEQPVKTGPKSLAEISREAFKEANG